MTAVTPYLCVKNADQAIGFYARAFSAVETVTMPDDNGRILYAELRIDGARVMICDEFLEIGALSPGSTVGSPVTIVVELADADAVFDRAVASGAVVDRPMAEQMGGAMRSGKIIDPFGHRWTLLTQKPSLSA